MRCRTKRLEGSRRREGVTLIELIAVMAILTMLIGIASLNYAPIFGRSKFESRAQDLIDTFQLAWEATRQSENRYAVVLDFDEQMYMLRQYRSLDFEAIPEEQAVIKTGYFDREFQLDYVLFDDLESTLDRQDQAAELKAIFYAGRSGWQYGGKVVLLDGDGNPWSLLVKRLNPTVQLVRGDQEVPILIPLPSENMVF